MSQSNFCLESQNQPEKRERAEDSLHKEEVKEKEEEKEGALRKLIPEVWEEIVQRWQMETFKM